MYKIVYLLFTTLFFLFSCNSSEKEKPTNHTPKKKKDEMELVLESSQDLAYSDSMIAELTKPKKNIKIDSSSALHSFDTSKFLLENCQSFDAELLIELDLHGIYDGIKKPPKYPLVTAEQKELLGIDEYLCDRSFHEDFKSFIFHASSPESHFTNSIHLLTIQNHDNTFNRLLLCQKYMSENYEYDISSSFVKSNRIIQTKEERFNISNNITEDDSTSTSILIYSITDKGTFKLNS